MSSGERRVVLALLGLAVLGQGALVLFNRGTKPGEAFLLPDQRTARPAAHRDSSERVGRPLQPGETIDADRASAAELARLPGVGMRLAKDIVADREIRGSFGGPAGLQRVRGIGPATVRRLEPFLRFSGPGPAAGTKPNLNSMTLADLERLPGVGPARARSILAYRDRNGPFADARELERVGGIGPKLAERLAAFVSVR